MKFHASRLIPYLLIAIVCCAAVDSARGAGRPNIVLVMIDDFGYECLSANGSTSYQTPNIDRLAGGGVRGLNCFVQPLCTPTRVQLMTGKYNVRNYTHFGHLDTKQTTFGNLFKRAGYATCITGKWQLGRDMKLPAHFGFDNYCLWQLDRRPPRYANAGLEIDGKHVNLRDGKYGPDVVNQYARDFIASHKDEPFFLYYPMILTHTPLQPTPDSADWDPSTADERSQRDDKHLADMVAYTDKLIGKLDATLSEQGIRDNTLLIVIGDNGTTRGIESHLGDRTIVGAKGSGVAAGMQVPLVASWPGVIPEGLILDDLVDSTDFLPTICEAAGVEVPSDFTVDGRSFLPQLRGQKGNPRDWIYCWYSRHGGSKATFEFAMDKHYKVYADGRFFDLTTDIDEQHPLKDSALTPHARDAKQQLAAVFGRFQNVRPKSIIAQADPRAESTE